MTEIERVVFIRKLPIVETEMKVREMTFDEWFMEQATLAIAIDDGNIFQKVGKDFLKVNIRDIPPIPESMVRIKQDEEVDGYGISSNIEGVIKNLSGDFKTWILRVVNLGLRFPGLELYMIDGDGEYSRVVRSEKKDPEVD